VEGRYVVDMDNIHGLPITRRRALAGALLLAAVVVLAARHLVRAGAPSAPHPAAIVAEKSSAAAAPKLVVHVVGAVRRPGLYRLREGSRIADAVARAGGATRKADTSLVNLAAPVSDGVQVVVPRRVPAAGAQAGGAATGGPAAPQGPVRLSTATLEQLDALPGIGPVTAQKILDYRQENGGFASVDELDAVPGIGPARMEQLREVVAP
jgi:competence protein ComEA